mgnify:CR=1 FL=1
MTRASYHHGNLREAILKTALRLARANGARAVVAREVAREVGVASAAIYRHFDDIEHLRAEVSRLAREQLARTMIAAREDSRGSRDRRVRAVRRFTATGRAYVQFAIDEPGLFSIAFADPGGHPETADADDPSAWDVLNAALDDLVDVGALDPALRQEAPLVAWTSVHGLACLVTSAQVPPQAEVHAMLDVVLRGTHRALGISGGSL